MKEWALQVTVDINDGDYLKDEKVVDSPAFLDPFLDLIKAIKKNNGRFQTSEYARDGEDYVSVYCDQLGFPDELVEEFNELFPDGEFGYHTIISIQLVQREIFETITFI